MEFTDLSNLILTIDTREKNTDRINSISDAFENFGACVEFSKLELCDYHIQGIFRDKEINLGIEAKSLPDYANSYKDLSWKLLEAYKYYEDVAIFVETGQYGLKIEGLHAFIRNPKAPGDIGDILTVAELHNSLQSFRESGIIVHELSYAAQFPYTAYATMIYLSKEFHHGVETKIEDVNNYTRDDIYWGTISMLVKIPGIGIKTAQKLMEKLGNLYWCVSMSEEDIADIIGRRNARNVYEFFRSTKYLNEIRKIK